MRKIADSLNLSGAVANSTQTDGDGSANDILLPNQNRRVKKVAVDIGGSLAKVVYYTNSGTGGRLNFAAFETDKVEKCVEFIKTLVRQHADAEAAEAAEAPVIMATGGGAHRFRDLLSSELGVEIRVEDEMESLTTGLNFLMREVTDEVFTYSEDTLMRFESPQDEMFPYMLVNIGSGVSIIKVTGPGAYERISGTSLGGGTLWGLLHLLTGVRSFDEMLEMTRAGDNTRVDMMVGDIYGSNYDKIGLKATNIAATMAGVYRKALDKQYGEADIARSLLYMVSNNIGQIAYLNAQLHGITRIYFGGYFIRGHPPTMHTLSYAINFWSKGAMSALFLRHEGFLGAAGAFVIEDERKRRQQRKRAYSFTENFSVTETIADHAVGSLGMLDRQPAKLVALPQLDSSSGSSSGSGQEYQPDTVDLSKDAEKQRYWIDAMERNARGLVNLAGTGALEGGGMDQQGLIRRLEQFRALYVRHLARLREQPLAYGKMSVRTLLGLREQCLQEVGLEDVFAGVKRRETEAALLALPRCLAQTDAVSDERERLRTLLMNVLAGNMFDWGASDLRQSLADGSLDFERARHYVTLRQATCNPDEFIDQVLARSYQRAVVFVDNSGADICLGVLPLARFLSVMGVNVVLAANSRPALNDVTSGELTEIVRRAGEVDSLLRVAGLTVCGTGSGGPCLDLRKLDEDLVRECGEADLVVLVGMGRAIHTNYFARFSCDSLKLAVFKNQMAADAAGAQLFDALCLFTRKKF